MSRRLLLVRHGTTTAVRAAAFPGDEPLDDRGFAEVRALAGELPREADVRRSAALRCLQTAEQLGRHEAVVDPELREADFGAWSGRSVADLYAQEPESVAAWMSDEDFAPPGGESLRELTTRVAAWMEGLAATDGATVAVTHGGVVRAAIVTALGAAPGAAWRVDVSPASVTELHAHDGRWRMTRANWTSGRDAVRAQRRGGA